MEVNHRIWSTFTSNDVLEDDLADATIVKYLPIIPASGLWLLKLGIGNDERFAQIFRDTWRQIPLKARRLIVKFWRRNTPPWAATGLRSPTIQLTDYWEFSERSWRQKNELGICGLDGHGLFFYGPVVDKMPQRHVEELIAHELAHVVQSATDGPPHTDRTIARIFDTTENIADEYMEGWGFDSEAMDEWLNKNWTWPGKPCSSN